MQPKSIILFFYGYILFFRRQIANHPDNLKWLDASANASKGDRDLMEWGKEIDLKTGKTNFEKYGIDEKKLKKFTIQPNQT